MTSLDLQEVVFQKIENQESLLADLSKIHKSSKFSDVDVNHPARLEAEAVYSECKGSTSRKDVTSRASARSLIIHSSASENEVYYQKLNARIVFPESYECDVGRKPRKCAFRLDGLFPVKAGCFSNLIKAIKEKQKCQNCLGDDKCYCKDESQVLLTALARNFMMSRDTHRNPFPIFKKNPEESIGINQNAYHKPGSIARETKEYSDYKSKERSPKNLKKSVNNKDTKEYPEINNQREKVNRPNKSYTNDDEKEHSGTNNRQQKKFDSKKVRSSNDITKSPINHERRPSRGYDGNKSQRSEKKVEGVTNKKGKQPHAEGSMELKGNQPHAEGSMELKGNQPHAEGSMELKLNKTAPPDRRIVSNKNDEKKDRNSLVPSRNEGSRKNEGTNTSTTKIPGNQNNQMKNRNLPGHKTVSGENIHEGNNHGLGDSSDGTEKNKTSGQKDREETNQKRYRDTSRSDMEDDTRSNPNPEEFKKKKEMERCNLYDKELIAWRRMCGLPLEEPTKQEEYDTVSVNASTSMPFQGMQTISTDPISISKISICMQVPSNTLAESLIEEISKNSVDDSSTQVSNINKKQFVDILDLFIEEIEQMKPKNCSCKSKRVSFTQSGNTQTREESSHSQLSTYCFSTMVTDRKPFKRFCVSSGYAERMGNKQIYSFLDSKMKQLRKLEEPIDFHIDSGDEKSLDEAFSRFSSQF